MGTRYTQNQPEQTNRRDVQTGNGNSPDASMSMQNEVYGGGRDRMSQAQQAVARDLNSVTSHLQNAEDLVEQRGPRAATQEYAAAIRAADSIDQKAVAQERDNVRQALQSGNLDAQTRRALVQEDADLHTLQRAPGFARANYALLMIRNGDQYYGTQLLLEAEQKDPEMNQDPNFQRHLKNAIDAGGARLQNAAGQQTDTSQQPGNQQIQQPGNQQIQQPGNQQIQQPDNQQIQQPGNQQIQQPGGNPNAISPLDSQNHSPVEAVQAAYATVQDKQPLTPAQQQAFQQAIANADAGTSPRLQQLQQQEQAAAQAVQPLTDKNLIAQVTVVDNAAQQAIGQMPQGPNQQKAAQLYGALDKATSAQERQAIEQQLIALNPAMKDILAKRDQLMGPQNIQALINYQAVESAIAAEKNQQAITRFTYGLALAKSGDAADAKTMVADALRLNNSKDPDLNAYWQRTAAALGVDTTAQPGQQARPGDASQQPGAAGGTAADMLKTTETAFRNVVDQKGDVKAAYQQLAPQFQAAIQKADQEFTALNTQLGPQDQQLQAQIQAKLTPQVQAQLTQIGTQIDAEKAKLTQPDLALYNQFQDPATTDAQRQQIHATLAQHAPKLTQLADQMEQSVGKDTLMGMMKLASDHAKMQDALMGRFLTRYYLADAANLAGDNQTAQTQLVAAFQAVPPDYQKQFATKPEVQTLAGKVGLDLTKLPAPTDAVLSGGQTAQPGQPGQPGKPGDVQQPGTVAKPGDQTNPAQVAGVSPENQGLRPDQIMANAQRSLQQNGMTDATKKQFDDAIKTADAMYGPNDQQMTQQLLQVLQSGKKADGTALTPPEKVQAHQLVQQEFAAATLGMQYRMAYGQALNANKQYASAEKVFKDNIAVADKLPLPLFQQELNQLNKDVQDPSISRANQADLFTMMQAIQGQGTSKDDGLMYMPITARKQAALFYVGGAEGSAAGGAPVGIVKPELAMKMIDDAKAKEKELYNVDLDKDKKWDPTLANMAQGILPLLPENLRKEKQKSDSLWSNVLVDAGVAATVLTVAGFAASVMTKNPTFAKMGMATGEGSLTLLGKGTLVAGTLTAATVGRHYAHEFVTGENEDWTKSAIHGTAGVVGVAAIMGTRMQVGKFLWNGASEQQALLRASIEKGTQVEGAAAVEGNAAAQYNLTAGQLADIYKAKNWVQPETLKTLLATEGGADTLIVKAGQVTGEAPALGLTTAQASTFTKEIVAADKMGGMAGKWQTIKSIPGALRNANPFTELDLVNTPAAQLSSQLGARSFMSGYSSAFAGIGTYNTISSFDRPIDPKTGQPISLADSFVRSNFRSISDNTATEALWLGILPVLKDGAMAKNLYAENAGVVGKTWGAIKYPFKPSAMGAISEGAGYSALGRQAAYLGVASTFYNFNNLSKLQYLLQSRAIGHQLDAMNAPIQDQSAVAGQGNTPKVQLADGAGQTQPAKPGDAQVQQQQQQPAQTTGGISDQAPPPGTGTGADATQNQQQQPPGGLSAGTPGLGE